MNTTLDVIRKTREYLDYIEEHVGNVEKAWEEFQSKCTDEATIWDDYRFFSMADAVKRHDISKLSAEEFVQYREAFYPTEDEGKKGLGEAWTHHKENNNHHWEHWTQLSDGSGYVWEHCIIHMILDWMAMGYKFGDTPREYYEKNKNNIHIPENAERFMYQIFKKLESTI